MGLPVASTTIVLYDYWGTGSGVIRHYLTESVTGQKGEFSFDVRRGLYCVELIPNRDTRFARQYIEAIKVDSNKTLPLTLQNGCSYSGTVRFQDGGVAAGCEMRFIGIEPHSVQAFETADDEGRFSITLPKGKYYLSCSCKHGAVVDKKKMSSPPFLSPTWITVDLWKDLSDDLVLPELVSFKGAVTNAEGHPVMAVRVTVTPSVPSEITVSAPTEVVCLTSKIGQFECLVEPGTYDVKLEPPADSHLSERKVNTVLVDQARTRTYSLGKGYSVQGKVTFANVPVTQALITASGINSETVALTDDEGNYLLSLSGGRYDLTITAQPDSLAKLPFRLLAPYTRPLDLAEDTELNVELEEGSPTGFYSIRRSASVERCGKPESCTCKAIVYDVHMRISTCRW